MIINNKKMHIIKNNILFISLFPNIKATIDITVLVKNSTNFVLLRNVFFINK